MSDRNPGNLPEMNTEWSARAGDYEAQRRLDYKLVGGVLRKADDGQQSASASKNRKVGWIGSQ